MSNSRVLVRRLVVLGQRERLSLDALADDSTANAASANARRSRSPFRLFDMHGLEIDEVMPLGDSGRLAAVATEVFSLPTFDLGVASASGSIANVALPTHDVLTLFKRKFPQRFALGGAGVLWSGCRVARPATEPQGAAKHGGQNGKRSQSAVVDRIFGSQISAVGTESRSGGVLFPGILIVSDNAEASMPVDLPRIERAVREILAAVGENPNREGLLETPGRVARMYAELFSGLHSEPARHLKKVFVEEYDELVLVRDITFNSMCEHHLLPFIGKAHVGYLPNGKIAGLSKLARVVEEVSKRPQVQERMTHTIADLLHRELDAKGVVVVLEAEHSCMTIRGVRKPGSITITSAVRGLFLTNQSSRAEVMSLINQR